jgi:predicted RNA-binding Zn-ribbon protein involved in translation (DUF1610 family)
MRNEDDTRECPMCGERMHRRQREDVSVLPGTAETRRRLSWEWVCPDCDHFEEDDGDDGE